MDLAQLPDDVGWNRSQPLSEPVEAGHQETYQGNLLNPANFADFSKFLPGPGSVRDRWVRHAHNRDVETQPVWGRGPAIPRGRLPRRVDVAVVGGGITGVSLLQWLGGAGLRAILLERAHLAAGASGRNAGFLLAGVAANYAIAARTYGRETARAVWELTLDNHRRLAEALAGGGCGYARTGSWTLAASAEEAASLQEAATMLAEDLLPGVWMGAPEVPSESLGGLLNPADGEIDPVRAVHALAITAPPGSIFEGVEVTAIDDGGVSTGMGDVEAGAVVLATNAYTALLQPGVPVRPVRAQMLATDPAPHVMNRPTYAGWGFQYWRQTADGRVLLGGFRDRALEAEVGYDATPTDQVQGHLDAHLGALGVDAEVSHRWAGIMGFTPDELPLVGPVPGRAGLHVCGGYSGHGLGFAFNAARLLVDHLAGAGSIPAWLDPGRFA
jgi:gamma-glutamylputrescine oxidase